VGALLIDKKITTSTHAGVRQMFGLHFVKTGTIEKDLGKFYSDILTLDKQLIMKTTLTLPKKMF